MALVEDERTIADLYRIGLEARGFAVSVFHDGPPFFESLETALPDFVLLDWNLPSLTGGDLLERLRRDERTRRLRVAVLSNFPRRHFADTVLNRLGALAWLEKTSTTPMQLADIVARLLVDSAQPA